MSIDYMIYEKIKISQPDHGFRFGTDSVLLARFATIKRHERVIDIGSGSGVIATLLATLKGATDVTAVEIQEESFHHLQSTVELNGLSSIITPVLGDIKGYAPEKPFDVAICNPPYRPTGIGKVNLDKENLTARFDETLTIDDLLLFGKRHVRYGGRLAFCGDVDRLIPAINACSTSMFQPKRLRFLHGNGGKGKIFFMECVYGGGVELSIEPPIKWDDVDNILKGDWK